jgi:16S rRNA C1402 (ribose-2'-O) methylase RsmI
MRDLAQAFGTSRRICVAYNLTLPDEQVFHGTAVQLAGLLLEKNLKGEFVVVIEGIGRDRHD